jgi:hypothetical protein
MIGREFIKTYFVLLISYFIIRILYDRCILGYLDLRVLSLLELIIIPFGLTIFLFVMGKFMKITITETSTITMNDSSRE